MTRGVITGLSRTPEGPPVSLGLGVDVGLRHEATGICVVESEWSEGTCHFNVRHLERLHPGTTYPALASRVAEILTRLRTLHRHHCSTRIYVDLTGHGAPVRDEIVQATEHAVHEVRFNHGDLRRVDPEDPRSIIYGKALLVARLTLLLQKARLHLPNTEEARTLAEELLSFRVEVHKNANDEYGDFKVGTRDELVTALGLAVQVDLSSGPPIELDIDLDAAMAQNPWRFHW